MPVTIQNVIARIQKDKKKLGITLYEPASVGEVAAFELATGIQLPDDVKTFYRFANGFESEEDMFRIIPLDEIVENRARRQQQTKNSFEIAEYMIYCDLWSMTVGAYDANNYVIHHDTNAQSVMLTHSFAEFLEVFLNKDVYALCEWACEGKR